MDILAISISKRKILIIGVILVPLLRVLFALAGCSDLKDDSAEFQKEIKLKVDPYELQGWATLLVDGKNPAYASTVPFTIKKSDLPSSVRTVGKFGPEFAGLSKDAGASDAAVTIIWGGGFGHWGLVVGKPGFVMSNSDVMVASKWIDGV